MEKKILRLIKLFAFLALIVFTFVGCFSLNSKYLIPYQAIEQGKLEEVIFYLENGGKIDARSEFTGDDYTMLWKATESNQYKIVVYLVEKGANVNALGMKRFDINKVTPLAIATNNKFEEIIQYLTDHGGYYDSKIILKF